MCYPWQKSMRIELAGWKSEGLRCPDITVDFRCDGAVPAVALLQMPNGTGKTTTLELLKATLSGEAREWNSAKVRSYRRNKDHRPKGSFEATLLADGQPLTIELCLNYDDGEAVYLTTSPGSGGVTRGWHIPPQLNRFLTPAFLNLFVFDGEFAGRLLDGNRAEADGVIDALCQLYMLDEVSAFAEEHWERSSKAHSTRTALGLSRLVNTRDSLAKRRRELAESLELANSEIADLDRRIVDLNRNIEERLSRVKSTRIRHDQEEKSRLAASEEVAESKRALMSALRMPHAVHPKLAKQLANLRNNLDRLRLPENTSAQFFEELITETECICGRPMDEHSVCEIKERASRYLDADDAGVINALKKDIELYASGETTTDDEGDHQLVKRLGSELNIAVRREIAADQRVRRLMMQLIDAGDNQLELWQKEREEKDARRKELGDLVSDIEGPGDLSDKDENTRSLSLIDRRLKERNDQIAQIRGTVRLRKQTETIKFLLKSAAKRARERIKSELVDKCNQRLAVILENDPLLIDRIDKSIRLQGQEGASTGQTLSVGYTFLMSVLDRGRNNFPLVVDSPAGPIDEGVRHRIGRLLPRLCTQFVGFTINTERVGFVDALESEVDDILFLTLFRKTAGTRRLLEALPAGKCTETETAVLVDDREYFFRFDVGKED